VDEKTNLKNFEHHINIYLQRCLTYDTDVLNAFRGILVRHQLWSYWGIPLVPQYEYAMVKVAKNREEVDSAATYAFLSGLAWYSTGTGRKIRTSQLPSWSWVKMQQCTVQFPKDIELIIEATPNQKILGPLSFHAVSRSRSLPEKRGQKFQAAT